MGPRSTIRFGTANVARLILSLIIAFAIWAFVTNERDPDRSETYTDLEIQGSETLGDHFQVVDSFPTVDVTVKGPESVVQSMTAANAVPSVDLSHIDDAGTYDVEVQVTAPSGLRDIDVDPEVITVEVGTVVTRQMEITIVEPVNPPATLTSIRLSSTVVSLIGVEQNVERVERVEVPVVLSGRTESFSFQANPIPYDENNQPMTDIIRVEPETVQVTVEFEVRAKSVPVIVQCACPTEGGGLEIRDLQTAIAIPSTVRIEGPEPLLEQVTAVKTIPINIDTLEESGFMPNGAELDDSNLPEGVSLERQSIDVYVEIEQSIQTFADVEIDPVNVPDDVEIAISPPVVTFELQGPTDVLATLEGSPPAIVVDLNGLEPGTHVLTPRVLLPPDVRVVNVQPEQVQVMIEAENPTPTPPPPPTPTTEPADIPTTSIGPLSSPLRDVAVAEGAR